MTQQKKSSSITLIFKNISCKADAVYCMWSNQTVLSLFLSFNAVINYLLNFNSKWCANTYLMYNELDNSITMTFVAHLQYFRLDFFFPFFFKIIFVAFGITLLINGSQLCSKRNVHQLKHFSFNALLARVYTFWLFCIFDNRARSRLFLWIFVWNFLIFCIQFFSLLLFHFWLSLWTFLCCSLVSSFFPLLHIWCNEICTIRCFVLFSALISYVLCVLYRSHAHIHTHSQKSSKKMDENKKKYYESDHDVGSEERWQLE